jgi:hypothetical protein
LDPRAQAAASVRRVSADCTCTGANAGFPPNQFAPFSNATLFPADYGQTYQAWDAIDCPVQWQGLTLVHFSAEPLFH